MKANGAKLIRFIETKDDKGFTLVIDYDTEGGQYLVIVTSPSGKVKTETFGQTFTPTFGMDVADMNEAGIIAEKLANELESEEQ